MYWVVEYNTLGGSTGKHGAVGISIRDNNSSTIRYNNIGGFLANLVVHGRYSSNQNYTFSNNTFMGTLTGNQRHVVVYDGNNRTQWHTDNIPNYSSWGASFSEDYEKIDLVSMLFDFGVDYTLQSNIVFMIGSKYHSADVSETVHLCTPTGGGAGNAIPACCCARWCRWGSSIPSATQLRP